MLPKIMHTGFCNLRWKQNKVIHASFYFSSLMVVQLSKTYRFIVNRFWYTYTWHQWCDPTQFLFLSNAILALYRSQNLASPLFLPSQLHQSHSSSLILMEELLSFSVRSVFSPFTLPLQVPWGPYSNNFHATYT